MDIQWYPGHMTKARRQMQEDLKIIDLVIELLDARVPDASRNPDIDEMAKGKPRIVLLNKSDLADRNLSLLWKEYFERKYGSCLLIDSRKKNTFKNLPALIREACKEKIERDRRRGIKNRPLKVMVAGIPNVGKSTFINTCAGRASAKTGNKPGVTRGKQWIRMDANIQLLDTPGILWSKIESQESARKLALSGSVRDEILNIEELALYFIVFMKSEYPGALALSYGVSEDDSEHDILRAVGEKRGCIIKGGEVDLLKAAGIIIDDFRKGELGHITLEKCPGEDTDD